MAKINVEIDSEGGIAAAVAALNSALASASQGNAGSEAGGNNAPQSSEPTTPEPAPQQSNPASDAGGSEAAEKPVNAPAGGSAPGGNTQSPIGNNQSQPAVEKAVGALGKVNTSVVPNSDGTDNVNVTSVEGIRNMSRDQINDNWEAVSKVINLG